MSALVSLVSSQKLILFKDRWEHIPGNLRESYVQEKRAAFPYDDGDDLPLNSFTPADHHAAHEWTPIKRQNDRKKNKEEGWTWDVNVTSFPPEAREEGGGRKKREKYRLRLAYTLLWSEETLHHAARFFFSD